jgi:NAD-dependent deacetylase
MKKTASFNAEILKAAQLIKRSSHMVVFTGAGISTPSGIPDFRSPNTGLWNKHDPFTVASIYGFRKNPQDFFDWIRPLAIQAETAEPNNAHICLAELEKKGVLKATITQNIDQLHQKAGSQNVLELHGSAKTATCPHCDTQHSTSEYMQILISGQDLPECKKCGKIIKPDMVLFGEMLPMDIWESAQQHCLMADLMIVVGSSLEVSPANSLPEMSSAKGARLIINNLSPTFLDSRADILLPMDVTDGMAAILHLLNNE